MIVFKSIAQGYLLLCVLSYVWVLLEVGLYGQANYQMIDDMIAVIIWIMNSFIFWRLNTWKERAQSHIRRD